MLNFHYHLPQYADVADAIARNSGAGQVGGAYLLPSRLTCYDNKVIKHVKT